MTQWMASVAFRSIGAGFTSKGDISEETTSNRNCCAADSNLGIGSIRGAPQDHPRQSGLFLYVQWTWSVLPDAFVTRTSG